MNEKKKILFSIAHPAEVHVFKNSIKELKSRGHSVQVIARQKEVVIELLDANNINYTLVTTRKPGFLNLAYETLVREIYTPILVGKFNPDVIVSNVDIPIAHSAFILQTPFVIYNDVEENYLPTVYPLADRIYTPHFFSEELGNKHHRYDGYHELAYLHPDWYSPNDDKLTYYGINPKEPYVVLRFVEMDAYHDRGHNGFSDEMKINLVNYFTQYGDVYISSEGSIPNEISEYELSIPPHLFHDLLYYADVCIGDSQAIAAESAMLGTPTVRSNSFCRGDDISKFKELETEYGLLHSTPDESEAFKIAKKMFKSNTINDELSKKRKIMFNEKIDLTKQMVKNILNISSSE